MRFLNLFQLCACLTLCGSLFHNGATLLLKECFWSYMWLCWINNLSIDFLVILALFNLKNLLASNSSMILKCYVLEFEFFIMTFQQREYHILWLGWPLLWLGAKYPTYVRFEILKRVSLLIRHIMSYHQYFFSLNKMLKPQGVL